MPKIYSGDLTKMFDISGKKAVIIGGAGGFGKAIAEGYAANGCDVLISSRRESALQEAKAEIEKVAAPGVKVTYFAGDAGDVDTVKKMLDFTVSAEGLGGCDILVNAQGINQKMFSWEIDNDYFEKMLHTNITSMMYTCRYFGNWMKDHNLDEGEVAVPQSEFKAGMANPNKGYGKIIMIASMCSWFGGKTVPAYSAAKGGVMQLCKAFSNDLLQYGINVNAIAPGYMDTEMNVALTDPKNPKFTQQRYDELTQRIPAHRWGTPDDMKGCCIFLASHASDYLGGAIIPVDGGYLVM